MSASTRASISGPYFTGSGAGAGTISRTGTGAGFADWDSIPKISRSRERSASVAVSHWARAWSLVSLPDSMSREALQTVHLRAAPRSLSCCSRSLVPGSDVSYYPGAAGFSLDLGQPCAAAERVVGQAPS